MSSNQWLVKLLRKFRTLHRWTGLVLCLFLLTIAFTGFLLGWKKNIETLQPKTMQGASDNFREWKSFEEISTAAIAALNAVKISSEIDRLDVRPDKGIVKVMFKEGYWEVQVDGKTGNVLSVAQRHSDWIEHIHDGSIISDNFKLAYTNVASLGLFFLALSGLYLWYGPKAIRKSK